MLCLTHWIQRLWPPTGTVPWIWAILTAHTQVEAGPETRPNPPPRPQQSFTCGYHAIHRVLSRMGLSPKLAYPLPTTDQEVRPIRKLVCEILAAAAEDGKLHPTCARATSDVRRTEFPSGTPFCLFFVVFRLPDCHFLPFYANLRLLTYILASVVHFHFSAFRNVRDCQKCLSSHAPSSYSYCLRLWSSLFAVAPTKKRCRQKKESNKGHAQLLEA